MPVGVFFDGFSSTAEMLDVCREAEAAGATSLWFAQHMGYREAMVWATAAASVTRSATLVPTAISPYLWPPLPIAMAISTLGELAQGRVILNVSVGNILNLGESGIEPVKPIRIMREYVEALRALLGRQAGHARGRVAQAARRQDGVRSRTAVSDLHRLDRPADAQARGRDRRRRAAVGRPDARLDHGAASSSREAGVAAKKPPAEGVAKASFINFNVSKDGAAAKAAHAAQACLPVPQPRTRRQHQVVQPRHRPSGDHGCASRVTTSKPPSGSCRRRLPACSRSPARRRNAATGWRNIWRSASTSRSSRSRAISSNASSRSTS